MAACLNKSIFAEENKIPLRTSTRFLNFLTWNKLIGKLVDGRNVYEHDKTLLTQNKMHEYMIPRAIFQIRANTTNHEPNMTNKIIKLVSTKII